MSRQNGHDSLQHTTNVQIIRSRIWRSNSNSQIHKLISSQITWRRRRRRCNTRRGRIGCLELARIWAALCQRKVAPIGVILCIGSKVGKDFNPKCSKNLLIKTGKKRAWAEELLQWTSTKERMKRWGKLIEASVTRAYKNAHLSKGIVCKWEMDQNEWQEIWKKR